jgi:two-component system sensor histidine kinase TctE
MANDRQELHRRGPRLTLRLTVAVTLILILAASGALYLAREYGRQAADEAFDRLLTGASLQIAERISVADDEVTVDLPVSAFELLALARADRVFYRIIDTTGKTLTGYDDLPLPPDDDRLAPKIYSAQYSGETVRLALAVRPVAERQISGDVRVIIAQTVRERTALARDIAAKAAILIGVAALAIILLAIIAVRYALSPLTRVERALIAREPNDLSPFVIETPRELETVVDAINRFTRRLDRRIIAVQDFVADAAHQLRTPITAIRAQAELAVSERDPERLQRINNRILDRSIAVSRLADQLLSHAMITHRADSAPREPLDLRRVALEADEETRRLDQMPPLETVLDLPEDAVRVIADRFSLREAVKNLIVNARTHGKPPIHLIVRAADGFAAISVVDQGEGIDPAQRDVVGTRFGRTASTGGWGLGLAIARDVAAWHDGTLRVSDVPGGGFEVALVLPAAGEPA